MVWIGGISFIFWSYAVLKLGIVATLFRDNPSGGTLAGGIITACLFVVAASTVLVSRRGTAPLKVPETKLILLLLAWVGLSAFWTDARSVAVAWGYWCVASAEVLAVACLVWSASIERIFRASMHGYITGGLVLAVVLAFSGFDQERLGDEHLLHPNAVGAQFALASLLSLYMLFSKRFGFRSKPYYALCLVVSIVVLVSTLSKTSILAFLAAAIVFLLRSKLGLGRKAFIVLLGFVSMYAGILTLEDYFRAYFLQEGGYTAETLSGRTALWEHAWLAILDSPWIGHGILSFRDFTDHSLGVAAVHAHNEVVMLLYQYGIVGLVLVCLVYLRLMRVSIGFKRRNRRTLESALALSLLVFGLLRGLTEAHVVTTVLPLILILLVSVAAGSAPYRSKEL